MQLSQKAYILMGIGSLAAVLFTSYVPSTMKVLSNSPKFEILENVSGIDKNSLMIARQKGY